MVTAQGSMYVVYTTIDCRPQKYCSITVFFLKHKINRKHYESTPIIRRAPSDIDKHNQSAYSTSALSDRSPNDSLSPKIIVKSKKPKSPKDLSPTRPTKTIKPKGKQADNFNKHFLSRLINGDHDHHNDTDSTNKANYLNSNRKTNKSRRNDTLSVQVIYEEDLN
jgi:hypothetical protein